MGAEVVTFEADNSLLRTVDHDRRLELIYDGGGAEGGAGFKIVGRGEQISFSARAVSESLKAGSETGEELKKGIVWAINWYGSSNDQTGDDEIRATISDALTAFKSVHGSPEWAQVRVTFDRNELVEAGK